MRPWGAKQLPGEAALYATGCLVLNGCRSLRGGGKGVCSSSQSTEGQGNCDGFEHCFFFLSFFCCLRGCILRFLFDSSSEIL